MGDRSRSNVAGKGSRLPRSSGSPVAALGAPMKSRRRRANINRYRKGKKLGSGAFGTVFQGIDTLTGCFVAIKEVKASSVKEELSTLQTLKHPNIVRYIDYEHAAGGSILIYMELVEGGSLASVIAQFGKLKEPVVRKYTAQVVEGLIYLHEKGILHRDIKSANLLVSADGAVKLADFGTAKGVGTEGAAEGAAECALIGTPQYLSPEAARGEHSLLADVWALGCVVVELASGHPPWHGVLHGETAMELVLKIAAVRGAAAPVPRTPPELTPPARDFVARCLQRDPAARAPAAQLRGHAWLSAAADPGGGADDEFPRSLTSVGADPATWGDASPAASPECPFRSPRHRGGAAPRRGSVPSAKLPRFTTGGTSLRSGVSGGNDAAPLHRPDSGSTSSPGDDWAARQPSGVPSWVPSPASPGGDDDTVPGEPDPGDGPAGLSGLFIAAHLCNDAVAEAFFEGILCHRGAPDGTFVECSVGSVAGPLGDGMLATEESMRRAVSVRSDSMEATRRCGSGDRRCGSGWTNSRAAPTVVASVASTGVDRTLPALARPPPPAAVQVLPIEGTPDGLVTLRCGEVDVPRPEPATPAIPAVASGGLASTPALRLPEGDAAFKFDMFFDSSASPRDLFAGVGESVLGALEAGAAGGGRAPKKVALWLSSIMYAGETAMAVGKSTETLNVFAGDGQGLIPLIVDDLFRRCAGAHEVWVSSLCAKRGKPMVYDNLNQRVLSDPRATRRWRALGDAARKRAATAGDALRMLELPQMAFTGCLSPHMLVFELRRAGDAAGAEFHASAQLFVSLYYCRQWTYWLNGLTQLIYHNFAYEGGAGSDATVSRAGTSMGRAPLDPNYASNPLLALAEEIFEDERSLNVVLHTFHQQAAGAADIHASLNALCNASHGNVAPATMKEGKGEE